MKTYKDWAEEQRLKVAETFEREKENLEGDELDNLKMALNKCIEFLDNLIAERGDEVIAPDMLAFLSQY